MGKSAAMRRLMKNSKAVNALMMFSTKFTRGNDGQGLCVTYGEALDFMSAATFAKAKLWCIAFGFLHCKVFGRLERQASIYDLSTKWKHLSRQPEKLDRIERLLKRHDRVMRLSVSKIHAHGQIPPQTRKRMLLRRIEKQILSQ